MSLIPGAGAARRSVSGVLFGLLMIPGGILLLFWNEGRTVKYKRALKEGAHQVTSIDAGNRNSSTEGKLVHFSGMTQTSDTLTDHTFNIRTTGICLTRQVEMYQWQEKNTSKHDSSSEKYIYEKKWAPSLIESGKFKDPYNHSNPVNIPYAKADFYAQHVTVGAYTLPEELVRDIRSSTIYRLDTTARLPIEKSRVNPENIYIGNGNESSPEIGDVRITFTIIQPTDVSVIGRQVNNTLEPYTTHNGKEIFLLSEGIHSADAMFKSELKRNSFMGWVWRFLGWLVITIGIGRIFSPLTAITGFIPIVGGIVNAGKSIVSFILGSIISLVVVAISWIFFRPVLSIILLAVSVLMIMYLYKKGKKTSGRKEVSENKI